MVRASKGFQIVTLKITVSDAAAYTPTTEATADIEETDEETVDRIRERFDMLGDMTKAVRKGAMYVQ